MVNQTLPMQKLNGLLTEPPVQKMLISKQTDQAGNIKYSYHSNYLSNPPRVDVL